MKINPLLSLLLCICFSALLPAQARPELAFELIATGLDKPLDITGAGDGSGRLFVVDQDGLIRIVDLDNNNEVLTTPYLNITGQVRCCGEQGLLGLAFDPDYATNGYFYVNYVSNGTVPSTSNGQTVIARFQAASPGDLTVDPATQTIIDTFNQPAGNHNAGDLEFGPDGFLYIPLGDGGGSGDPQDRSQNTMMRLGKLLRIDVSNTTADFEYDIPADNPFVGDATVLDEIFAIGLRNPFRISFDQAGNLWIADVGQNQREEVSVIPAGTSGQNFGWNCREGFRSYSGGLCPPGATFTDPVFDYGHDNETGGRSITGGFVYRGNAADLQGYYICADYISLNFFLLPPGGGRTDTLIQAQTDVLSISTFGEDDNGELYVGSLTTDRIFRITTAAALPAQLTSWTARPNGKYVDLAWTTAAESGTADFLIERGSDGETFTPFHTMAAAGDSQTDRGYTYRDTDPLPGESFYRLVQRDLDGTEADFGIRSVRLSDYDPAGPVISPNPARNNFSVRIPELQNNGEVTMRLFSADGREVFQRVHQDGAGPQRHDYDIPGLTTGVYQVVITYDARTFVRKLVIE